MNGLEVFMSHPAVQAAVAPFAVALVVALVLRGAWQVLALGAALFVTALLSVGFSLESLTATRKLVLLAVVGAVLWPAVGWQFHDKRGVRRGVLGLFGAAAVLWMLERLLLQMPLAKGLALALASIGFLLAMLISAGRIPGDPVRSAVAATWLGLGAGVLAVLGSSAVLGLLGIAVGAAAAAVLLVRLTRNSGAAADTASWVAEVAALAAGLIVLLATFVGDLSWWALLPLVGVPWILHWPILERDAPPWRRGAVAAVIAGIPVIAAGALAWVTAQ